MQRQVLGAGRPVRYRQHQRKSRFDRWVGARATIPSRQWRRTIRKYIGMNARWIGHNADASGGKDNATDAPMHVSP